MCDNCTTKANLLLNYPVGGATIHLAHIPHWYTFTHKRNYPVGGATIHLAHIPHWYTFTHKRNYPVGGATIHLAHIPHWYTFTHKRAAWQLWDLLYYRKSLQAQI